MKDPVTETGGRLLNSAAKVEVRPMREEDAERVIAMKIQAFNPPAHRADLYRLPPSHEGRVLTEDGKIRATLRIMRFAQFFGGRAVPSAGISSVVVAPETRGKGYGRMLMEEVLRELKAEGMPLSVLYPSTPSVYRKVGYEIAGAHFRYSAPIWTLPSRGALSVEPWEDDQLDEIKACYRTFAERNNGMLDRPDYFWQERVMLPNALNKPIYRYLQRQDSRITGYVILSHEGVPSESSYHHSLICRDLIWNDSAAANSILAFAAGHRALGVDFEWSGSAADPLVSFLDGRLPRLQPGSFHWMLRLVDVEKALRERAYPANCELTVEFSVVDHIIPENSRTVAVKVAGGRAEVGETDSAEASVDVNTLAALYTGWLTARQAESMGKLPGATLEFIRKLEWILAGPSPWLGDFF